MKKRIRNLWLKWTTNLTDMHNNDATKVILSSLFHDRTTEESIILFTQVQAAFNKELKQRQIDAEQEYRSIVTFFGAV